MIVVPDLWDAFWRGEKFLADVVLRLVLSDEGDSLSEGKTQNVSFISLNGDNNKLKHYFFQNMMYNALVYLFSIDFDEIGVSKSAIDLVVFEQVRWHTLIWTEKFL